MFNFEEKVIAGLQNCGIDLNADFKIGLAASGGADSTSLLVSLCSILKPLNIPLQVITVNHFIRPEAETCGDVDFVVELCKELKKQNFFVECTVVELQKGQVEELSRIRKSGIEESARYLRYQAFENFINNKQLDFLCLAHNLNDNFETVLMRFLQGSSSEGLKGIASVRGKFIRPLSLISRSEIEEYLISKNYSWRVDSTNFDTNYSRNKIRQALIPFLDEKFDNWQSGVISSINKASEDYEILQWIEKSIEINMDNSIDLQSFLGYPVGLQKRIIIKMCNQVCDARRISNGYLEDILNLVNQGLPVKKHFEDVEIECKKGLLLVKKYVKTQTDFCFSDIINKEGNYSFWFGNLIVKANDNGFDFRFEGNESKKITIKGLPVLLRNYQYGDEILTKDKSYKKIVDIFSDWHVMEEDKERIPLIQELNGQNQEIIAVVAGILGYSDWIVND